MFDDRQKKLLQYSLEAAAKHKSPLTGFIHYHHQIQTRETIPLLENIIYCLSLLKTKMIDNVSVAKKNLERLLNFYVTGSFPVYLHEYPISYNPQFNFHVYLPLKIIYQNFFSVLGEKIQHQIKVILEDILQKAPADLPYPLALRLKPDLYDKDWLPSCETDWADYLNSLILLDESILLEALTHLSKSWVSHLGLFREEKKLEIYLDGEPKPSSLDLWMSPYYDHYTHRFLKDDGLLLHGGLVPNIPCHPLSENRSYFMSREGEGFILKMYWGDEKQVNSLVISTSFPYSLKQINPEHFEVVIDLHDEEIEGENIWSFYINKESSPFYTIDKKKATVFKIKESLAFKLPDFEIQLISDSSDSSHLFLGTVLQGSRPSQARKLGMFEAYDWIAQLRSVKRKNKGYVKLEIKIIEV